MSTVYKELAEEIIAKDGYYEDDPRIMQVITYTNSWGGESYAILYESDLLYKTYEESDFIINPKVIWEAKTQ